MTSGIAVPTRVTTDPQDAGEGCERSKHRVRIKNLGRRDGGFADAARDAVDDGHDRIVGAPIGIDAQGLSLRRTMMLGSIILLRSVAGATVPSDRLRWGRSNRLDGRTGTNEACGSFATPAGKTGAIDE